MHNSNSTESKSKREREWRANFRLNDRDRALAKEEEVGEVDPLPLAPLSTTSPCKGSLSPTPPKVKSPSSYLFQPDSPAYVIYRAVQMARGFSRGSLKK